VLHRLALLRDRTTAPPGFRRALRELAQMLFFEAASDLPTEAWALQTPLADSSGVRLSVSLGLAPILRAGLGMAEAIHDLAPDAQVWHLGLYRDHDTCLPVAYYNKLPARPGLDLCFVIDPMLATGGSAVAALDILRQWGVPRLRFLGVLATPEGVRALQTAHPDVPIYLAAVDDHLNESKYIVPGLGDAGDRQFATG
jgi:uracil phosphoribosyltransferase